MVIVEGTAQLGRRERKKLQTRDHIAETARRLFVERGFAGVSVAEVARVADVAEQTVYNYFVTKEDLVYWRLGSFEDQLIAAVRDRPIGETALAAFGRFIGTPRGLLASDDPEVREQLAALTKVITDSPALLAREQSIFAAYTTALARLLATETEVSADDTEPWIAANAMIGVHRALIDYSRLRIGAGASPARLRHDFRSQVARALTMLERGLGAYAIQRSRRPAPRSGS